MLGFRTVHAFGNQEVEDARFATNNTRLLTLGLRSVEISARFSPALQLVSAFGTAALLWVGGYGALEGWWTAGVLVVATTYLKNMMSPMKTLAKLAPTFTASATSAERIRAILDHPAEHLGVDHAQPARSRGRLRHAGSRMFCADLGE